MLVDYQDTCYTLGDCDLNDLNNPKIFPFLFLTVVKYICNQVLNVAIRFPNYCLLPQRHVFWNMVRKGLGSQKTEDDFTGGGLLLQRDIQKWGSESERTVDCFTRVESVHHLSFALSCTH